MALGTLRRVVNNLGALSDGRSLSTDICDANLLSLELVHREFIIADSLEGLSDGEQVALNFIKDAIAEL